ncbi:MAG: cytochrome c3 family protein [Bacteroidota bacterium]
MRKKILLLFCSYLFWFGAVAAQTSIKDTKHNLSVTGIGGVKAQSEQEICVFCHTPHRASADAQLWNRQATAAAYTFYSSDYLTSKTYPAAAQPNAKSKLCMSCHDGTIALGSVYNTPGTGSRGPITMSGGVTTMPTSSAGFLGTTLTDDHPVGFGYDNAKDPDLVVRSWPWNTAVRLDPDAFTGRVECHTCHDPHNNEFTKFLRISNANASLCTFCHNKINWSAAIHKNSTQSYTPPGGTATTIGEWACRSCHQSHSGTGAPYILRFSEENTCYAAGCHGTTPGTNTKDIQSALNKTYRHPTNFESSKHLNPDNSTSLNVPNRHAECQDCHNPHQAKDGLHTIKSNAASNVLTGARGVTPGTATKWTQPTTFSLNNPVTQEYQICLKCHSYYGFGTAINGVTTIVGPSGMNITDQAMEYNVSNYSAHPVAVGLNNQTGSYSPRAMTSSQMTSEWSSVGTQTMYCSDCHGNDEPTAATVPQGAHGSNARFMLTGTRGYWPYTLTGKLWTLGDVWYNQNNWQNDLFCVNCHPLFITGDYSNEAHDAGDHNRDTFTIDATQYQGIPCVSCHLVVPHGGKRSRLIAYGFGSLSPDVAPYIVNQNVALVRGFKKANPTQYTKQSCYSTYSACHPHGTNYGGYDP